MSVDIAQTDAASNPAAGVGRLKARTNGGVTARDSAGVERDLGQAPGATVFAASLANDFVATSGTLVAPGLVVSIPPGKSARIVYVARGTQVGGLAENRTVGLRFSQGAGANGSLSGSAFVQLSVSTAAAASALEDGDVVNVAAGATVDFSVTGSVPSTVQFGYLCTAVVKNNSTNATATVSAIGQGNTGPVAVVGSSIHGVIS